MIVPRDIWPTAINAWNTRSPLHSCFVETVDLFRSMQVHVLISVSNIQHTFYVA